MQGHQHTQRAAAAARCKSASPAASTLPPRRYHYVWGAYLDAFPLPTTRSNPQSPASASCRAGPHPPSTTTPNRWIAPSRSQNAREVPLIGSPSHPSVRVCVLGHTGAACGCATWARTPLPRWTPPRSRSNVYAGDGDSECSRLAIPAYAMRLVYGG